VGTEIRPPVLCVVDRVRRLVGASMGGRESLPASSFPPFGSVPRGTRRVRRPALPWYLRCLFSCELRDALRSVPRGTRRVRRPTLPWDLRCLFCSNLRDALRSVPRGTRRVRRPALPCDLWCLLSSKLRDAPRSVPRGTRRMRRTTLPCMEPLYHSLAPSWICSTWNK
jgi:hypothetical protein